MGELRSASCSSSCCRASCCAVRVATRASRADGRRGLRRFAVKRAARDRARLLGRDARLLLAAGRDRLRLRGQRGPAAAASAACGQTDSRRPPRAAATRRCGRVRGRGELRTRCCRLRRSAARARGTARTGCRSPAPPLAGLGLALGLGRWLVAWRRAHARWPTLPTFLPVFACGTAAAALMHRRAAVARAVVGAGRGSAQASIARQRALAPPGHRTDRARRARPARGARLRRRSWPPWPAHPPAALASALLRGLGTISYGLYRRHLPVLLWPRFTAARRLGRRGAVARQVAALSVARRHRQLGARRAPGHRGRRPLARRGRDACRRSRPSRHVKPLPSIA